MANTNPARGMRDFLPSDVRKRNYVIGIIKEVYESYGFEPLETPAVENIETLTGKYGEEGNQLIFKILKRGEKLDANASEKDLSDLALRYDLTVPLARVVANHKNELPKFFKRYQIQPVWRADRPARGRYREFYQCDVDAIGSNSMMVEAELCAAVSEILERLGFNNFRIRVNHRKILLGILELKGVPTEKQIDALTAIDKIDKIGEKGVLEEITNKEILKEIGESVIQTFKVLSQISDLMRSYEDLDRVNYPNEDFTKTYYEQFLPSFIDNVKLQFEKSIIACEGLNELKKIIEPIISSDVARRIIFDFSLARGLSYYTGAIFEISVPDLAGSIAGGGRYDGLIGMFGKEQIPAVGFSLGLERILLIMEERGMFPKELSDSSADVLVTVWNEESIGESLAFAAELRKQNLRVLVYPEADKLGKQFKYADSIKVPFVCVLGETELAENKVTLKNLRTGEQETIDRKDVSKKLKV